VEHDHEKFMRLALEQARKIPTRPFGSVIVGQDTGEVLAVGVNQSEDSPIWHGEMDAIHRGATEGRVNDWSRAALYTTAEPCPMCAAAALWAGLGAVVYGTSLPYLARHGWWQIDIRAEEVFRRTPGHGTRLVGGVLEDECNQLFHGGR